MRFLILSCNTGGGHNSAAAAIKETFEKHGLTCDIMDALSFWSNEKSKLISKGHSFIYRNMPKLFCAAYKYEENHPAKDGNGSLMFELVTKGCSSLADYLRHGDYDKVICTHIFSSMMMTKIRKDKMYDIPFYFVATDYTCSPGVGEVLSDIYFIPHKLLIEEFILHGIRQEKICVSGIPVSLDFYNKQDKKSAREKLGLPQDKFIFLLTLGSMGCGPIKEIFFELTENIPYNSQLVVICGNNRRLYKLLNKDCTTNAKIIGYTSLMNYYMQAADILITKPGGLTSTEAAVRGLPMIFIDAVGGCETRNFDFFVNNGLADCGKSIKEITELCMFYAENCEKLGKKSEHLRKSFDFCAGEIIYNNVVNGRNVQ